MNVNDVAFVVILVDVDTNMIALVPLNCLDIRGLGYAAVRSHFTEFENSWVKFSKEFLQTQNAA